MSEHRKPFTVFKYHLSNGIDMMNAVRGDEMIIPPAIVVGKQLACFDRLETMYDIHSSTEFDTLDDDLEVIEVGN